MKKLLAIALAVVMTLGAATVAFAFSWDAPAADSNANGFGYEVDVVKYARQTGALASSYPVVEPNAKAVNGADVYFAIKVVIPSSPKEEVKDTAELEVKLTSLDLAGTYALPLDTYAGGTYYVVPQAGGIGLMTPSQFNQANAGSSYLFTNAAPVFSLRVMDTDTAKVAAKVISKRPLPATFDNGDYTIDVQSASLAFYNKGAAVGTDTPIATFSRNGSGKVTGVASGDDSMAVLKLYRWLGNGNADVTYQLIDEGKMYMSDDNIRAAWGWNYKAEDSITWAANADPIITGPALSIPKTGARAGVAGFALLMVAAIAAAAAYRRVKA
ncbi:MAG: hypothetical protein LBN26_05405 [Christensenellaceae bacterium]|jgi:hypothetical protein|nr:hypothetical protein [Christensenellaceae bacterium]